MVVMPDYIYPAPIPALLEAAAKAGLPIERFDRPRETRLAAVGDSVSFLISLRRGADLQQWVLSLVAADLTEKEARLPPLKGFQAYSSTGVEFNFTGRRAAIELRLIGPMKPENTAKDAPKMLSRRVLVNAEYLEFGFDSACDALIRIREEIAANGGTSKLNYRMKPKPFSPEIIQASQAVVTQIGLTPDRERAVTGAALALPEFLNLIVKTPGLQDILKEVVDVSWWSVLTGGGKARPKFKYLSQHMRRLPPGQSPNSIPQSVFPFLLMLNDKPAMACVLVVTEPRVPFAATGGVVAIQAGRPYDQEPQLTVRALATRFAAGTALPTAAAGQQ